MLQVTQLSGFGGGGMQPPQSLIFVASSTSTGETISIPLDAQAGDLAVLADFIVTDGTPSPISVVPTDWTEIVDTSGLFSRLKTCYRILPSGAGGSSVTGMNSEGGASFNSKVMLVFRPDELISSVSLPSWGSEQTVGNPAQQTVAASGVQTPLVVVGVLAGENTSTPSFSVASPAFDDTVSINDVRVGYKIYNSSPSDHSIDMGDLGSGNFLQSGYLRVS